MNVRMVLYLVIELSITLSKALMRVPVSLFAGMLPFLAACASARQSAPQSSRPVAYAEDKVLSTPSGMLYGTLLLPQGPTGARFPVALLIAGSGNTDRDGNTPLLPLPGASPLRMVAESLANHGIGSLRYDKRGVGASKMSMQVLRALRFDDYVSDAAAWVGQLRTDPRVGTVVIIGHSEGALIGTVASKQLGTPLVSLDGTGDLAATTLHAQIARLLPAELTRADEIMRELSAGRMVDSIPGPLRQIFSKGLQPYVISWFQYDPSVEMERTSYPVLIIQGRHDLAVTPQSAERLSLAAGTRGTLMMIDSMSHELKIAGLDSASQMRTYTEALPLAPQLVTSLVRFVHRVSADAH